MQAEDQPKKFYSTNQIGFITFMSSAFGAGWVIGLNYKNLGKPRKARTALLIGIAITILIGAIALFIPKDFPKSIIAGVIAFATKEFSHRLQGPQIKEQVANGAKIHSGWYAFLISLVLAVFAFGIVICGLYLVVISGAPIPAHYSNIGN